MKPSSEQVFTTKYVTVPMHYMNGIKVCMVGDIHSEIGGHCSSAFDAILAEWRQDIANERKGGPNLLVVFTGDESDSISTSERKGIVQANLHGGTIKKLDDGTLKELKTFESRIDFLGPRLVGMIQGNHHWVFSSDNPAAGVTTGLTSTQWLCQRMGCQWLGFLTYLRLSCFVKNVGASFPLDMVVCHGKAGNKLMGTSLNQILDLKMIFPAADVYCMAHDHQLGTWKTNSLVIPNGPQGFTTSAGPEGCLADNPEHLRVAHQEQVFIRSGSCLKGYEAGVPSYTVAGLFRPTAMGMARLAARIKRTRKTNDEGKTRAEWNWDLKATV